MLPRSRTSRGSAAHSWGGFGLFVAFASCTGGSHHEAKPQHELEHGLRTGPTIVDGIDGRDQYAFVARLERVKRGPTAEVGASLASLRDRWIGRRYRWEVGFIPSLCKDADACVALPVDHSRLQTSMPLGWLARLSLSLADHHQLVAGCAELTGQCVFTFEATLTMLAIGKDQPTSIGFDAVSVGELRRAAPTESWVRASRAISAVTPHARWSRLDRQTGAPQ